MAGMESCFPQWPCENCNWAQRGKSYVFKVTWVVFEGSIETCCTGVRYFPLNYLNICPHMFWFSIYMFLSNSWTFVCRWPHLKSVGLHDDLVRLHYGKIPDMIRNWRNLEELSLGATDKNLEQILEQVSIHCKKLYSLCLSNTQTSSIHGDTARSIVSFLPNIKHLTLRNCGELRPEDLVTIIRGCKDLVYLDVRNSSTLLVGDEQLAKLASHIGTVLFDRSNVA